METTYYNLRKMDVFWHLKIYLYLLNTKKPPIVVNVKELDFYNLKG